MLTACLGSTAPLPSERPFRSSASGSLLEFLQRGHTTAMLQSVPAFLLTSASVGPRFSGKARSEPRQAAGKLDYPRLLRLLSVLWHFGFFHCGDPASSTCSSLIL